MEAQRALPFFNRLPGAQPFSISLFGEVFRKKWDASYKDWLSDPGGKLKKLTSSAASDVPLNSSNNRTMLLFILTQIVWFSIGLSLFYDTAETVFHVPHRLAVALYSVLMVGSAWMGVRVMVILCLLSIPPFLGTLYFSFTHALPGESLLALWSQMVSAKSIEYTSGLMIMMGSMIGCVSISTQAKGKKINIALVLSMLGIIVGNGLVVYSGVVYDLSSGTDLNTMIGHQTITVLGVMLYAMNTKKTTYKSYAFYGQRFPLSLRIAILALGILTAILYDWFSQYFIGWMYYASMVITPMFYFVLIKMFPNSKLIHSY